MVGRKKEQMQLLDAYNSKDSEFVAVFGRRRVGKTFLIRETFDGKFTFQHTGVKKGGREVQLERFRQSLMENGLAECPEYGEVPLA